MVVQRFFLLGEEPESAQSIDITQATDLESLRNVVGVYFAVVVPGGLGFRRGQDELTDFTSIESANEPIGMTIDGHGVRDVPGPPGLPGVGNYFEVFPDHLGNNQRLFEKYGPLFKTTNMGATIYQTNDPQLAQIAFTEGDFFSKEIVGAHPLHPIKIQLAGVFLGDSSDSNWKIVHKFLPPALGPKAVRHYSPAMNDCINESFPVFDELDKKGESWNVYQYMLKLSSGTVGKIMLGKDFNHFSSIDAPLHRMVLAIAQILAINKKIATKGEWYSYLPFGDPKRLKDLRHYLMEQLQESIEAAKSSGTEDLPLQDAALSAANVVDYLVRAADTSGEHLPTPNLIFAVLVATGAGFTTTSSLLSWLVYGLVAYEGMQERLLQELVNKGFSDDTEITAEMVDDLPFLDKYVKEMQRRHNPSYQPGRTAQKDMILPGGYRLQKGAVVVIGLHHIHINEKIWDNPMHFDPDRWDTEKVKNRPKTAYIPFAAGQRMCIGFNFALLEVKIFMCKLVWRYQWLSEGDANAEYDPFFQLIRPVDLYVRAKKREQWPSKSVDVTTE